MIRQRTPEWESRRFFLLSLLGSFLPGSARHAEDGTESGNKVKNVADLVRRMRQGSSYMYLASFFEFMSSSR